MSSCSARSLVCAAQLVRDDPRHEFVDAVDCVVGDTCEHEAQIRIRIEVVELRSSNESINRRCTLATRVGANEQIVATADRTFAIILR
jgi:hypothetical protein